MKDQITELEWRLSVLREMGSWIPYVDVDSYVDGGNAVGG